MELPPPERTIALANKLCRCTVLMVEDDPSDTLFQTQILLELGLCVISVTTGEAALGRLREDYQIAIIDLGLPGMRGLDLARKLREERPTLPIVIYTGDASSGDAIEALKIDSVMVEQKPLTAVRISYILQMFKLIL